MVLTRYFNCVVLETRPRISQTEQKGEIGLIFLMYNAYMIILGHRGAPGHVPENTLASFEKAIELGSNAIELDVQLLKTGELAVIHDETVDRTTNGTGYVADYTLEQIKRLETGHGQKVPLLDEVLDLVDKCIVVNIELKGKNTAQPVAEMISRYQSEDGWEDEHFLVSAVSRKELKTFKKIMPNIKIGTIISRRTYLTTLPNAIRLGADFTVLEINHVYPRQIRKAHSKGIKVYVFTINTSQELEKCRQLGVDGVFTDYPDICIKS